MPGPNTWKWCGHAHHFCAADRCRWHLATFVANGTIVVSSVGDYWYNNKRQTLGVGPDSWYETFVFRTDPTHLDDGCPTVISFDEIDSVRYATVDDANNGHAALCKVYNLWTEEEQPCP